MDKNNKQYGLILPSSKQGVEKKKKNIFDDDSDEEESTMDWVKQSLKKRAQGSVQQKEATKVMKKAIEEDPTVYQYDELYDEIEEKKANVIREEKKDRKSKYVVDLLKAAERRTRENEQRVERQVQKEREAEGDLFKDKDAFVTSAYRKKMEELQKIEDEQKRMDAIEAMTDVTKQKDISGFYRQLYKTVTDDRDKKEIKTEEPSLPLKIKEEKIDSTEEPEVRTNVKNFKESTSRPEHRHSFRKPERYDRDRNRNDDDEPKEKYSKIERDSKEETTGHKRKEEDKSNRNKEDHIRKRNVSSSSSSSSAAGDDKKEDSNKLVKNDEENILKGEVELELESKENIIEEIKPRVSIWEKRTVGTVFDHALERYLKRKEANSIAPAVVISN